MSRNQLLFSVFALIIIALLIPYGYVSVFDGHYPLTITVAETETVDARSLQFAMCWTDAEAEDATRIGATGETSFQSGKIADHDSRRISVPYSGRVNFFGFVASYNQPKYLIVQYKLAIGNDNLQRKQFSIPSGRGARNMRVAVP